MLVGPEEPQDPIPKKTLEMLKADPQVIFTGFVRETAPLYAAMDILVLPTYREGFPVVPLEASAMQLPVVATWVDGCNEAIIDGKTGILIPPKDTEKLMSSLKRLVKDRDLRIQMGIAGRELMIRNFKPQVIWTELYRKYLELITRKRLNCL
jgi:glycosyltransferase involved in cell wall biosynthesis